eukprot:TRINITY_DN29223_c2_g1_i1.p1 TRINITY_DN29223_c2_g1~~TRINITY_DN29223_c2_g1_i1.p1  ORF type:complete len:1555 (+),score=222.97 TRINITY_DN29223_c2_g1_i1:75-4739(+)
MARADRWQQPNAAGVASGCNQVPGGPCCSWMGNGCTQDPVTSAWACVVIDCPQTEYCKTSAATLPQECTCDPLTTTTGTCTPLEPDGTFFPGPYPAAGRDGQQCASRSFTLISYAAGTVPAACPPAGTPYGFCGSSRPPGLTCQDDSHCPATQSCLCDNGPCVDTGLCTCGGTVCGPCDPNLPNCGTCVLHPTVSPTQPPSPAPSAGPSASPVPAPTQAPLDPTASPSSAPSWSPSAAPSEPPAFPSATPSAPPSQGPSAPPSALPSAEPTKPPVAPTAAPVVAPSVAPTAAPTGLPSAAPTKPPVAPSAAPTAQPTKPPITQPSVSPSAAPSAAPLAPSQSPIPPTQAPITPTMSPKPGATGAPSAPPSASPSPNPTEVPSPAPSMPPTGPPSSPPAPPSVAPSAPPTAPPQKGATLDPTTTPSATPSASPFAPTSAPTESPVAPTSAPSAPPSAPPQKGATLHPTASPTATPSDSPAVPTLPPSAAPSAAPLAGPTAAPSVTPTGPPQGGPTVSPVVSPTAPPTAGPSASPQGGPTVSPVVSPTAAPSAPPTDSPQGGPTASPAVSPTAAPSGMPSAAPSAGPSASPQAQPSGAPTRQPSPGPSAAPSIVPSAAPSARPSASPIPPPSSSPSAPPSAAPSAPPSARPSAVPSLAPSTAPSAAPSQPPSGVPSAAPSSAPSVSPSLPPSSRPTRGPSAAPSGTPTRTPSGTPSQRPTQGPSAPPTPQPSSGPSLVPSDAPSGLPSAGPSRTPTAAPEAAPSGSPTAAPTPSPSSSPYGTPSAAPSAAAPTLGPSAAPSAGAPTRAPTRITGSPTGSPSLSSGGPTAAPSARPSAFPSRPPRVAPSARPSGGPTSSPVPVPSAAPSDPPTALPTSEPSAYTPSAAVAAEQDTAGAAAAVGAAGAAGPAAAQLAVLAEDPCFNARDEVPWVLHILRFKVAGSQKAGSVVGNAAILIFLIFGHGAAVRSFGFLSRKVGFNPPEDDVKGPPAARLRFPALAFIVGTVLYAGTTNSACFLVLRYDRVSASQLGVGIVGTLFITLLSPIALWYVVLRHICVRAVYERETPVPTGLRRWFLGEGDWVSESQFGVWGMWLERWGAVIKPLSPDRPVIGMLEKLVTAGAVSLLQAVPRDQCTECAVVDALTAAVLLASALGIGYLRPHARPRDNVAFTAIAALQGISIAIRAAAHGRCESAPFSSTVALLGAGALLILKGATDLVCVAYEATKSRRTLLFKQYLARRGSAHPSASPRSDGEIPLVQRNSSAEHSDAIPFLGRSVTFQEVSITASRRESTPATPSRPRPSVSRQMSSPILAESLGRSRGHRPPAISVNQFLRTGADGTMQTVSRHGTSDTGVSPLTAIPRFSQSFTALESQDSGSDIGRSMAIHQRRQRAQPPQLAAASPAKGASSLRATAVPTSPMSMGIRRKSQARGPLKRRESASRFANSTFIRIDSIARCDSESDEEVAPRDQVEKDTGKASVKEAEKPGSKARHTGTRSPRHGKVSSPLSPSGMPMHRRGSRHQSVHRGPKSPAGPPRRQSLHYSVGSAADRAEGSSV